MLIEELFSKGVMTMGVSKVDPKRQVGVFRPEAIAQLPAVRAAEMEKFRWISGEWDFENRVPATRLNPAYTDVGSSRFSFCEKDAWICHVTSDGKESRNITFDPFSHQWIYVLTQGSYGILRSSSGWLENCIVFSGLMTMIGIDCEWRMSWTKVSYDAFSFVNEQLGTDGRWEYVDEWHFTRRAT
jgi:hypothetical protein